MARDSMGIDRRKHLGDPIQRTCATCGRSIRAHTTTFALVWSNHRKAHERRGETARLA